MKTSAALTAALLWLSAAMALAFPPSPGFTVYGTVRDEYGWALDTEGSVIRFKNAATGALMAESRITAGGQLTENYRITLPLDHNRTGLPYRPGAVPAGGAFTIEAVINGVLYFPIPMQSLASATMAAGQFLQLDLALGADSDGDGLPDLWEQWQLEAAGLDPTYISLISAADDFDGDGSSNRSEFIAGTFALLAEDNLSLKFLSIGPDDWSTMEFLAVIDKTYVLERSADMIAWELSPFGADRSALSTDYTAPDTLTKVIVVPAGAVGKRWFYRLTVH